MHRQPGAPPLRWLLLVGAPLLALRWTPWLGARGPTLSGLPGSTEVITLLCGVLGLCLALALPDRLLERAGSWAALRPSAPVRRRLDALLVLALWPAWAALSAARLSAAPSPWQASGVDWHDSYLCAYALLSGDLELYAPYRYPLMPGLGAALSALSGLRLDLALQLLSFAAQTSVVVPIFLLGRRRFGRLGGLLGALLLLGLRSYTYNLHAVTPYPLFGAAAAWAALGLDGALRGRGWGWLLGGIGVAGLFLGDVKGALPGAVGLAVLLGAAVCSLRRGGAWRPGGALLAAIVALLPSVVGYRWMGGLPLQPTSLEAHSARVLVEGAPEAAPADAPPGYVFGRLSGPLAPLETLRAVQAGLSAPDRAPLVARLRAASAARVRSEYPGLTPLSLGLAALGLLLPAGARVGRRWARTAQGAVLCAFFATAYGLVGLEYQERYLLHVLVFLPMLAVGGLGALAAGALRAARGPAAEPLGWLLKIGLAAFLLLWTGSPLSPKGASAMFDPSLGGGMEVRLRDWAEDHLQDDDLLLDTTWMMSGLLALGVGPIARAPGTYPSFALPFPATQWRVSRPRPGPGGRRLALVGLRAGGGPGRGPGDRPGEAGEGELGAALLQDPDWRVIQRDPGGMWVVLEHTAAAAPPWWLPGGPGEPTGRSVGPASRAPGRP